jgi:myo-inositol-1(or 4)-monophosphatase
MNKYTVCAIEAAMKAGKLIKEGFYLHFKVSSKAKKNDLVTEYDIKSEALIINTLKKAFPKSSFLSEEKGVINTDNTEVEWIIDPIDGTINFAHKFPLFAISIAAKKDNKIISGVIYQPMTEELFVAEENLGAFLNDKKIMVSNVSDITTAFIAVEFPLDGENRQFMNTLLKKDIPLRRLGSSALNLAYVASGVFDGCFTKGVSAWDYAAGILLVKEAKGMLAITYDEQKKTADIIATNGKIHDELSEVIHE